MYASHSTEVPSEASRSNYREQIEHSFPFHPTVIEALYTRWGSHPDFQRTRGVLRLLASVVEDLWKHLREQYRAVPAINPALPHQMVCGCYARGAHASMGSAQYEAVAAADVIGEDSNAGAFDEERGGDHRREKIGRGLASAILLGSFGGQGQRSGFSAKDLKLACSRPMLNWSYTDGALLELEDRCFYLHYAAAGSLGKRYWFGTKPNLNKLVVQYRQQVGRESYDREIADALTDAAKKAGGDATWRVLVNPDKDLPEQRSLTLLVLPPLAAWGDEQNSQAVKGIVGELSAKRCGGRDRTYRKHAGSSHRVPRAWANYARPTASVRL